MKPCDICGEYACGCGTDPNLAADDTGTPFNPVRQSLQQPCKEQCRFEEALDRIAAEHDTDLMAPTRAVVKLVAERRELEAALRLIAETDTLRPSLMVNIAKAALDGQGGPNQPVPEPSTYREMTDAEAAEFERGRKAYEGGANHD